MKVILYMAVTTDGFIAKKDDDTAWVSDVDWKIFTKTVKDSGCIVMGRRTYEVSGGDFPYKGAFNIVMTKDLKLESSNNDVVFTNKSPREVIKLAQDKGYQKLLIIGGGSVNGSFMKERLIDEVFIDVHPFVFGTGIKVFESFEGDVKLELVDSKNLDKGQVLLHYKVLK